QGQTFVADCDPAGAASLRANRPGPARRADPADREDAMTSAARRLLPLASMLSLFLVPRLAFAGGPLYVAGTRFPSAVQGKPLVWDSSSSVRYRTPSSGGLGKMDN